MDIETIKQAVKTLEGTQNLAQVLYNEVYANTSKQFDSTDLINKANQLGIDAMYFVGTFDFIRSMISQRDGT